MHVAIKHPVDVFCDISDLHNILMCILTHGSHPPNDTGGYYMDAAALVTDKNEGIHELAPYTGAGIEFYKIPDKVLEHIGFNVRVDAYSNEEAVDA